MSLSQINDYGIGDVNLTSLMETLDRQRRGYQAVSLINYDNNSEPKITAGSIVELGGALFKCEADESITGWAGIGNNNDVYIKLAPSGSAATAAFVTAAPTWSTSKQGWYVGNDRYIGGLYKDNYGNYNLKWLYTPENSQEMLREGQTRPLLKKTLEIGDWDMDTWGAAEVDHGWAVSLVHTKVRKMLAIIINDAGTDLYRLNAVNTSGVVQGGITRIAITYIYLLRTDGGSFDNASFATPPDDNRGWIHLEIRA